MEQNFFGKTPAGKISCSHSSGVRQTVQACIQPVSPVNSFEQLNNIFGQIYLYYFLHYRTLKLFQDIIRESNAAAGGSFQVYVH